MKKTSRGINANNIIENDLKLRHREVMAFFDDIDKKEHLKVTSYNTEI